MGSLQNLAVRHVIKRNKYIQVETNILTISLFVLNILDFLFIANCLGGPAEANFCAFLQ